MKGKLSIWLYYLSAVIAIGFGALYFFKHNLMDYHYAYMNLWPDNEGAIEAWNPRTFQLMLSFKHIIGICLMGIGIGALFFTYIHSKNKTTAGDIGIFLLLFIPNADLLYISYGVAHSIEKGPKPPWMLSVVALVLLLVAVIAGLSSRNKT